MSMHTMCPVGDHSSWYNAIAPNTGVYKADCHYFHAEGDFSAQCQGAPMYREAIENGINTLPFGGFVVFKIAQMVREHIKYKEYKEAVGVALAGVCLLAVPAMTFYARITGISEAALQNSQCPATANRREF